MRTVKKAEERKNEILDAARDLFLEKGFDGTSTGDILTKTGIARGTLYYYFASKEEIMDALIERYNVQIISTAGKIAGDKNVPVMERIFRVVASMNISGGGSKQILEHIHKPQNALMHQKIQRTVIAGITPIMTGIINDGIKQGLFNTPYASECIEMIIIYANTVFDYSAADMTDEERALKARALLFNTERLLGAEAGSFSGGMPMFDSERKRRQ